MVIDLEDAVASSTSAKALERENLYARRGRVMHSYDGTVGEMPELGDVCLYIGINGCSLRTIESHEVVKAIPKDKLLLETDAP